MLQHNCMVIIHVSRDTVSYFKFTSLFIVRTFSKDSYESTVNVVEIVQFVPCLGPSSDALCHCRQRPYLKLTIVSMSVPWWNVIMLLQCSNAPSMTDTFVSDEEEEDSVGSHSCLWWGMPLLLVIHVTSKHWTIQYRSYLFLQMTILRWMCSTTWMLNILRTIESDPPLLFAVQWNEYGVVVGRLVYSR